MAKVSVYLREQENQALEEIAQREYRAPQAQAAFFIRTELERQGLLAQPGKHFLENPPSSESLIE